MSDILVIGASSFTGNRFCELMEEKGHRVERASWRGTDWIGAVSKPRKYIVNFAALNVVAPSWQYADDYMHQNVTKVAMLARALRDVPLTKYVHVSTPEVYGNVEKTIWEDQPHKPSTPYAVSRSAAEKLLMCEHAQYGLPVTFTRACNVYGPGQQLHRLIPKVLWCIKSGLPFPLEGGGVSRRAFVYVDDVCAATEAVMVRGEPGSAYHIGSDDHKAIKDVVQMCLDVAGGVDYDFIVNKPARPGQDAEYDLWDTARYRFGLRDRVPLREGITRTWKWINDEWETLKDQPTTYEFRP